MLRTALRRTFKNHLHARSIQTTPFDPPPTVLGGMIVEAQQHGKLKDLKKSILSLYRSFLRASGSDPTLRAAVMEDFRKNQHMDQGKVQKIDFLMRQGHKKLALVSTPGFAGYSQ